MDHPKDNGQRGEREKEEKMKMEEKKEEMRKKRRHQPAGVSPEGLDAVDVS